MTTQEEKVQDLVEIGFVRFKDDIPIRLYDFDLVILILYLSHLMKFHF